MWITRAWGPQEICWGVYSNVTRFGVTRGGNHRAFDFFYLFKMKNFWIFSLLHKKFNSSQKISDAFF